MGFVLLKVGKNVSNDFHLDREEVSPEHLEIFVDVEGNVYLTDLNSQTGTFVNGNRIHETVILHDEDEVKIANLIKFNWQKGVQRALANSFSIGSDPKNDIQLKEHGLDGFHIQIYKDFKNIIYVKDLDTVQGTFINGHRIHTTVVLNEGDILRLGKNEYDWKQLFIDKTFPILQQVNKVTPLPDRSNDSTKSAQEKGVHVFTAAEKKVESLNPNSEKEMQVSSSTSHSAWKKVIVILLINIILIIWLRMLL